MDKLSSWLVILIGVLLLLPLLGVTQLGSLSSGITAWVVAIVVVLIGILQLTGKKK